MARQINQVVKLTGNNTSLVQSVKVASTALKSMGGAAAAGTQGLSAQVQQLQGSLDSIGAKLTNMTAVINGGLKKLQTSTLSVNASLQGTAKVQTATTAAAQGATAAHNATARAALGSASAHSTLGASMAGARGSMRGMGADLVKVRQGWVDVGSTIATTAGRLPIVGRTFARLGLDIAAHGMKIRDGFQRAAQSSTAFQRTLDYMVQRAAMSGQRLTDMIGRLGGVERGFSLGGEGASRFGRGLREVHSPLSTLIKLLAVAGTAAAVSATGFFGMGAAAGLAAAALLKMRSPIAIVTSFLGALVGQGVKLAQVSDEGVRLQKTWEGIKSTLSAPFVHAFAQGYDRLNAVLQSPAMQKVVQTIATFETLVLSKAVPAVYALAGAFRALLAAIVDLDIGNIFSRVVEGWTAGWDKGLQEQARQSGATFGGVFADEAKKAAAAHLRDSGPDILERSIGDLGTTMLNKLLAGFTKADFSALNDIGAKVREALEAQVEKGERTKISVIPALIGTQTQIAAALGGLSSAGASIEETVGRVRAAVAGLGPAMQDFAEATVRATAAAKELEAAQNAIKDLQGQLLELQTDLTAKENVLKDLETELTAKTREHEDALKALRAIDDEIRDIEQELLDLTIKRRDEYHRLNAIGLENEEIDNKLAHLQAEQEADLKTLEPLLQKQKDLREEIYQKTLLIQQAEDALIPLQEAHAAAMERVSAAQDVLKAQQQAYSDLQKEISARQQAAQRAIQDAQRALQDEMDRFKAQMDAIDDRYASQLQAEEDIIDAVNDKWKAEVDGAEKQLRAVNKLVAAEDRRQRKALLQFAIQRSQAQLIADPTQRIAALGRINRAENEYLKKNKDRLDALKLEQSIKEESLKLTEEERDAEKEDAEKRLSDLQEVVKEEKAVIQERMDAAQEEASTRIEAMQRALEMQQRADQDTLQAAQRQVEAASDQVEAAQAQADAIQKQIDAGEKQIDIIRRQQELLSRQETQTQHEYDQQTELIELKRKSEIETLTARKEANQLESSDINLRLDKERAILEQRKKDREEEAQLSKSRIDEDFDKGTRYLKDQIDTQQILVDGAKVLVDAKNREIDGQQLIADKAQLTVEKYQKSADLASLRLGSEKEAADWIAQQRDLLDQIAERERGIASANQTQYGSGMIRPPQPIDPKAVAEMEQKIKDFFEKTNWSKLLSDAWGKVDWETIVVTAKTAIEDFFRRHPIDIGALLPSTGNYVMENPFATLGGTIGALFGGRFGAVAGAAIGAEADNFFGTHDNFGRGAKMVWGAALDVFRGHGQDSQDLAQVMNDLATAAGNNLNPLVDNFKTQWSGLVSWLKTPIEFKDWIPQDLKDDFTGPNGFVTNAGIKWSEFVGFLKTPIEFGDWIPQDLKDDFVGPTGFLTNASTAWGNFVGFLKSPVPMPDIFGGIRTAWEGISSWLGTTAEGIYNTVTGWFQNIYNTLLGNSIVPDIVNGIIGKIGELPGALLEKGGEIAKNVLGKFGEIRDGLIGNNGAVTKAWNGVTKAFREGRDGLVGQNGFVPSLWDKTTRAFREGKDDLVGQNGFITQLWNKGTKAFREGRDDIVGANGFIPELWSKTTRAFREGTSDLTGPSGFVTTLWSKATAAFEQGKKDIASDTGFVPTMWSTVQGAFQTGRDKIVGENGLLPDLWSKGKAAFEGLRKDIADPGGLVERLQNGVKTGFGNLVDAAVGADRKSGALGGVIKGAGDIFGEVQKTLVGPDGRSGAVGGLLAPVRDGFGNIVTGVFGNGTSDRGLLAKFETGIGALFQGIVLFVKGDGEKNKGLIGSFVELGKNMANGLIEGVKSMLREMVNMLGDLAKLLPEPVRKFLGIASPSTLFYAMGEAIPEGMEGGVVDRAPDVVKAVGDMATAVIAAFSGFGQAVTDEVLKVFGPVDKSGTLMWHLFRKATGEDQGGFFELLEARMRLALAVLEYDVVKASFDDMLNGIVTWLNNAKGPSGTAAHGLGQSIADGIAAGIRSRIEAIAEAAAEAVRKAIEAANKEAGNPHSPAPAFIPLGGTFTEGLAEGMKRKLPVLEAASRAAVSMAAAASKLQGGSMAGAHMAALQVAVPALAATAPTVQHFDQRKSFQAGVVHVHDRRTEDYREAEWQSVLTR